MNKIRRVINNTLISLFGQLVTWTSTLLLTIAYGRFLGDVKFGELYFAITFVSLIGFPVEFSFAQQLTRDVAEKPEKAQEYLWNTLLLKVFFWIVVFTLILFLTWALGYDLEQRSLIVLCGIDLLIGSVVSTFAALHYAFEKTVFPSVGMILEKGLTALIGFILLKNGASVETMALVLLGGSFVNGIWVALWFFRLTGYRVSIKKAILWKLLQSSIPFIMYGVLGIIYYRIDTVLLSLMTNTAVVGWYGAGYRLFDTLYFVPNIVINTVMYPVFSKLSSTSQSTLKIAVEKCMNLLLICVLPIAAFFAVAAPNIVGFLYHQPTFVNTIPVIQGLAPGLIFLYINALFFNIIVTMKGEKKIPIMAGLALLFNLGLNLFLIPRYQQVGAAVMTSLTELLLCCISLVLMPRNLFPRKSLKVGGKVLIVTLVMSLAIFLLRETSIYVILPIALLIYISGAILLKVVPRDDMQTLYKAIRHRGDRAVTDTLAIVADESIYTQITQRLPVVKVKTSSERSDQADESQEQTDPAALLEDDDITERVPVVKILSLQTTEEAF